jgi:ribonuclease HI
LELPATQIQIEKGAQLAETLHLHAWDYIIAGDGSATTWRTAAGFGSILYSRHDDTEKKFFGGFSRGTNNVAEMMAVILPLLYLEATVPLKKSSPPHVYVLSDSTYVVGNGNGEYTRDANHALWSVVDHLKTKMNLIFIHVNRNVFPANQFGDSIGNSIRTYFCQITEKLNETEK